MPHALMRNLDVHEVAILAFVGRHGPAVRVEAVVEAFRPLPAISRIQTLLREFRMLRNPFDSAQQPQTGWLALTNEGRDYVLSRHQQAIEHVRKLAGETPEGAERLQGRELKAVKRSHISHLNRSIAILRDFEAHGLALEDLNSEPVPDDVFDDEDEDIILDDPGVGEADDILEEPDDDDLAFVEDDPREEPTSKKTTKKTPKKTTKKTVSKSARAGGRSGQ